MAATTTSLHLPAGTAAAGPYALEVTPESAGWGHSSLRVLELAPRRRPSTPGRTRSSSSRWRVASPWSATGRRSR